jgi:serine protease
MNMQPSRTNQRHILSALAALLVVTACSAQANGDTRVERLIVKLRDSAAGQTLSNDHRQALEARSGRRLSSVRALANGAQLLQLPQAVAALDAELLAAALRTDPDVEYAEPDRPVYPTVVTPASGSTEPYYPQQWSLNAAPGGMYLPDVWAAGVGTGTTPGVIVAVVDSGYRPHVEFATRILPGYDFISNTFTANDGGGRDADPADPGDWVTPSEATAHSTLSCVPQSSSSWHGTFLTGIIAASGNNDLGMAGINWQAQILPLRVLGKCGGSTSDIIDAMYWAAGLSSVNGMRNPNPARIINLSAGSSGTCTQSEQVAINAVTAAGVVVVAAAGNDYHSDVANFSPASCNGVITVAATNRSGSMTEYTSIGSKIAISAPGGEQSDTILSTSNTGITTPDSGADSDSYQYGAGTSFATAAVSGVVSLILSVRPELTPAHVRSVLQSSANPIADSLCVPNQCGAGIVNATAAVSAAQSFVIPSTGSSSSGGGGGGGSADLPTLLALLLGMACALHGKLFIEDHKKA